MDIAPSPSAPASDLAPDLPERVSRTVARLLGVSAHHDGRTALQDVDVDVLGGRLTALVGPNGSGKSTLLGVLAGTHRDVEGQVALPASGTTAFVVQRSAVTDRLPITVRETVAMGRWGSLGAWRPLGRRDRAVVDDCLEALDVADLARRPLAALSGGQRQRVLVAQGLARQADLLLLDEPTAGVDAAATTLIRAAISAELARGATVVEATHDHALRGPGIDVVHLVDGRRVA
ncbi:ATP-binding cassette domain-containing protein [Frigoribacterium sp. ACAM 257]|uniref:zinc ABC transporter ATP-binding protein AztA n=1 Tax=Frigoribacterium sp. ACAM 257 TaxID=2508998 RepID=UPI0011BA3084|nr:zinc ABC transporter ATP-binding protein AztA [Frigoribacterium sp. ACAM 257]TWX36181.1 ATP-binding cassette domain-containing protein [Frigoribacterium sp. ACAM 257]